MNHALFDKFSYIQKEIKPGLMSFDGADRAIKHSVKTVRNQSRRLTKVKRYYH